MNSLITLLWIFTILIYITISLAFLHAIFFGGCVSPKDYKELKNKKKNEPKRYK